MTHDEQLFFFADAPARRAAQDDPGEHRIARDLDRSIYIHMYMHICIRSSIYICVKHAP